MARIRSPNYPGLSLGDAMVKVAQIFGEEHKHLTPRQVVAKHMGYSGVNGASLTAISALVKYGLLEQEGGDYRVTDLAIALTHPQSPEEKAAAVNTAASKPALFGELLSQFKGKLPSDENLRAYLIRRGFNQSALTGCINSFRETMKLVSTESGGYDEHMLPHVSPAQQVRPASHMVQHPGIAAPTTVSGGGISQAPSKGPTLAVMDDGRIEIHTALYDLESADNLIAMLNMFKGILPPKAARQTVPAASSGAEESPKKGDIFE